MATALALVAGAASLLAAANAQGVSMPGTMAGTFTKPRSQFEDTPSGCSTIMAGCTGTLLTKFHEVAGNITVQDDCTFIIDGWQFDGEGPAVEWWGAKQTASAPAGEFPYSPEYMANPKKIGELGVPGNYTTGSKHGGDSEVVVRLGKEETGEQVLLSEDVNYVSVWCEDAVVDFGSAELDCDDAAVGPASTPAASAPAGAVAPEAVAADAAGAPAAGAGGVVDGAPLDENAPDEVPTTGDVFGDAGANDVRLPGEEEPSASGSLAVAALTGFAAMVACLL